MSDENNTKPAESGCNDTGEPSAQHQAEQESRHAYEQAAKKTPESEFALPKVTFSTFVLSLGSSAMVHLGEVPEPESGQTSETLPLAKHTIDILAMLKDKTYGCLNDEEKQILDGLLYELRMKFVMKSK